MTSQPPENALTIKLPQAITVSEITITAGNLARLLDAATPFYLKNQPQDGAAVTVQLAMKTAARALLIYTRLRPQAGWSDVPKLTRHDDATAVVIKYMLTNFFSEILRRTGGYIDATAVPQALDSAPREGEYGELVTAIAGLVSGPDVEPASDGVSPLGSPTEACGTPDGAAIEPTASAAAATA